MPRIKGSITNGTSSDRDGDDFYETPPSFTAALLEHERFDHNIWEPAAGAGAIVKVLEQWGHAVTASDINPRADGIAAADFLTATEPFAGDIVTNPPFKLVIPFAKQAWRLCRRKFALVLPISGLNSSSRYQAIWSAMRVSKILLAGRYQHVMSSRGEIPSQFTHIWVVFDKEFEGPATFTWLPDIVYKHSDSIPMKGK
jgi:hypothetical protein